MSPPPLLALDQVTTIFGDTNPGGQGTVAVDQVSLAVDAAPPRILNIVGESGSGKTTVARMMLGLQRPTAGTATWNGHDIYALDRRQRAAFRRDVQAVFQDPFGIFNPYYRIDRVFNMAIQNFGLASSRAERRDTIEQALQAVNLRPPDVLGRYPHQLSGGERQRVMLARAYMLRPRVIVADEAISMLDVAVRATVMNILLDFKERDGMSTLFITHDLSAAYYLGGDIMIMTKGRAVETGPNRPVLDNPAHPYTQSLLRSIPSPDPDQRWESMSTPAASVPDELLARRERCLFAERCPQVMPACLERRPAMVPIRSQQAACELYRTDARTVDSAGVANNVRSGNRD